MRVSRRVLWIPLVALMGACTGTGSGAVAPVDTTTNPLDTSHSARDTGVGACGTPCAWLAGPAHPAGVAPLPAGTSLDSLHKGMVHVPTRNIAFRMGLQDSVQPADSVARPAHLVRFTYDLWMDRTEFTTQEFAQAMNWARRQKGLVKIESRTDGLRMAWSADSTHRLFSIAAVGMTSSSDLITYNASRDSFSSVSGTAYPMNNAAWYAAMICANYRSEKWGLEPVYNLSTWTADFGKNGYRLPTEAEYEFALRGGAGASWTYFWGSGWSQTRAQQYTNQTHSLEPVASNSPNPYGLHDLIGQLYQWTNDWYGSYEAGVQSDPTGPPSGTRRAVRAGPVADSLTCRVGHRPTPSDSTSRLGFRLVLPVF